jgi:hypothetical protein
MRTVVDTNVFISAALKDRSVPAMALRLVEQRGRLLKSTATERQLLEVMIRPHLLWLIAPATQDWFNKLLNAAECRSLPRTNSVRMALRLDTPRRPLLAAVTLSNAPSSGG